MRNLFFTIVIVGTVSIAVNNMISMTELMEMSEGYREASAGFYGSTLPLELVSSGIVTPVLEELVFRGILFTRLKSMLPKYAAIPVAALLFAAVHFNIVQFLYAFFIGVLLAFLMERAGHLYVAVAGHITANVIAVIRTETGILSRSVDGSVSAWVFSAVLLVGGLVLLALCEGKLCEKHMDL